jgi:hypothetical protein
VHAVLLALQRFAVVPVPRAAHGRGRVRLLYAPAHLRVQRRLQRLGVGERRARVRVFGLEVREHGGVGARVVAEPVEVVEPLVAGRLVAQDARARRGGGRRQECEARGLGVGAGRGGGDERALGGVGDAGGGPAAEEVRTRGVGGERGDGRALRGGEHAQVAVEEAVQARARGEAAREGEARGDAEDGGTAEGDGAARRRHPAGGRGRRAADGGRRGCAALRRR